MVDTAPHLQLISTGFIARRCGVSTEAVKLWDRRGLIVPALKIEGTGRRVWRAEDLPLLETQINARMDASGKRREPSRA